MKYILCYGDSNTWGRDPVTKGRYDFPERWPGVMQHALGDDFHIYENAMNGRTTVFEDPIEEGRNGRSCLEFTLMQMMPLDLVILMLGGNDTKNRFLKEAWDIAWGMDLLVKIIKRSEAGPGRTPPGILLASPVPMNSNWGSSIHGTLFSERSVRVCEALPKCYREIAKINQVHFFETGKYVQAEIDGVHMTRESHRKLGFAMAKSVRSVLALNSSLQNLSH